MGEKRETRYDSVGWFQEDMMNVYWMKLLYMKFVCCINYDVMHVIMMNESWNNN